MAQILVISDSHNLRLSLAGLLIHAGYSVNAASPGDMPHLLNTKSFDLLILELRTPFESGLKVLISVRSLYKLPVIVLSTATYPDVKQRALIHGARSFLLEPVEPEEIVQCVRKAIQAQNEFKHNITSPDFTLPHQDFLS
jgi:hypothetical protein